VKQRCKINEYGNKYWFNEQDQYHNEDDPAVEYVSGERFWYLNDIYFTHMNHGYKKFEIRTWKFIKINYSNYMQTIFIILTLIGGGLTSGYHDGNYIKPPNGLEFVELTVQERQTWHKTGYIIDCAESKRQGIIVSCTYKMVIYAIKNDNSVIQSRHYRPDLYDKHVFVYTMKEKNRSMVDVYCVVGKRI